MADDTTTTDTDTRMSAARAAVRRGVWVLDIARPGWRELIDPFALEMESCSRCIIGQIAATRGSRYVLELREINYMVYRIPYIEQNLPRFEGQHGFNVPPPSSPSPYGYEDLHHAWLDEIDDG